MMLIRCEGYLIGWCQYYGWNGRYETAWILDYPYLQHFSGKWSRYV